MAVDLLARSPAGPDDPALIERDGILTYGQVGQLVDRAAKSLSRDRAPLVEVAEKDVRSLCRLLAAWRTNRVVVPLHPHGTAEERDRARAAVAEATLDTQAVIWTSGTSGAPRGILLSFDNLAASAAASAERLELGPDDTWLASLSLAHVGGLALVTRSILLGSTVILDGPFDPVSINEWIDGTFRHHAPPITHLALVPTQLRRVLDTRGDRPPPETLRTVLLGGAHAPTALVDRAHDAGWPLALTYGATEMTSQIATATPAQSLSYPLSVGRPLDGVEVRTGPTGELETRGATLAGGALVEGPDGWAVEPIAGEDGWYRTKDFGEFDRDGILTVTGRVAERIVSGGVTVSAIEVEEALLRHPAIVDACVVGLPDEEWGERVVARIEGVEGELDLDDVSDFVAELLAPAKRPKRFSLGVVPRNPNGKADRDAVRHAFTAS